MHEIHAVIVNYNTREMTLGCLEALTRECEGIDARITVVDNGSHDGSVAAIAERFPGVFLIENGRNQGFSRACNRAFAEGPRASFHLLVNSDTLPSDGVVRDMLVFMKSRSDAGVLGPRLVHEDGRIQHSYANGPSTVTEFLGRKLLSLRDPGRYPPKNACWKGPGEVESLVGAFMMVRSESWIEAGGFDERYFFFLEETDLCRRIARSGKRVLFHPGLRVIHAQGGSADRDPAWARYQFFRSRYRFLEKWEGSRAVRAVYAKYFAWLGVKTGVYALLLLLSFGRFEKIASRLRVAAVLFRAHCSGFDPILPPGYPTGGSGDGDTGKGRKDPKAAVQ